METGINLLQDKQIAIVGGGPGGLTLARLLQLKGATVKVYERDSSQAARVQGAIVDLHFDSGLLVMEAAGLMDAFKASYMPGAEQYRMVDEHAHILLDEHEQEATATFGDEYFRPEIDRGALRDMLIAALLPGTVVWDSQFESMTQVNQCWELQFKNGQRATADLVIGAEGHRSKIRSYVTDIEALYSGATIIQGEIDYPATACPDIYALADHANLMAMGTGKSLAVQPRGDGGLTFYASSLYPENWIADSGIDFTDSAAVQEYLLSFYQGWSPVLLGLFKACTHFVARPLNYFPTDQVWDTKADVTLIGDSAHLMPPSGEGVNTAMLDALDLSNCLSSGKYEHLQQALAAYERQMRERAALLGREAVDGIKDFASPTPQSIREMLDMFGSREA